MFFILSNFIFSLLMDILLYVGIDQGIHLIKIQSSSIRKNGRHTMFGFSYSKNNSIESRNRSIYHDNFNKHKPLISKECVVPSSSLKTTSAGSLACVFKRKKILPMHMAITITSQNKNVCFCRYILLIYV